MMWNKLITDTLRSKFEILISLFTWYNNFSVFKKIKYLFASINCIKPYKIKIVLTTN